MLALAESTTTGLLALAGTLFVTVGTVTVAYFARSTRQQSEQAKGTVSEFQEAWQRRGELLDGLEADLAWSLGQITLLREREQECRERLAALEATLGPHTG